MGRIALRGAPVGGGRADFALTDGSQTEPLEFLPPRHDRVSVETVCSGPGDLAAAERLAEPWIALTGSNARAPA